MQQFRELDFIVYKEATVGLDRLGYNHFRVLEDVRNFDRATGFMERYYNDNC